MEDEVEGAEGQHTDKAGSCKEADGEVRGMWHGRWGEVCEQVGGIWPERCI